MKAFVLIWIGCFMGCFAVLGGLLPLFTQGPSLVSPASLVRLGGETQVTYGPIKYYTGSACGTNECYLCGGHGCECTDYEYCLVQNVPGYAFANDSVVNCTGFTLWVDESCSIGSEPRNGSCPDTYYSVTDP